MIGLRKAQEMNPLPADGIPTQAFRAEPEQNEYAPNVVPFIAQVSEIGGPTDPLTGPTSPDDMSGLVTDDREILAVLKKILIATRAMRPTTPLVVKGPATLATNSGELYKFDMGGKRIPALAIFVQNNTPQIIYIAFEDSANLQGIQVAPNGGILQVSDVVLGYIGLYVTSPTIIVGADNMGQPIAPVGGTPNVNVILQAWSNSEWNNVWGMAS